MPGDEGLERDLVPVGTEPGKQLGVCRLVDERRADALMNEVSVWHDRVSRMAALVPYSYTASRQPNEWNNPEKNKKPASDERRLAVRPRQMADPGVTK
jgi:hypothetical protein